MIEITSFFSKKSVLTLLALCAVGVAGASSFPNKPITLVVPFAAGGPTDVSARLYAKALEKQLGQPVVVDNKAGAGGTLGSQVVVRAKADGYTLLWGGTSTLAVAPNLYKNINYSATSFTPIGMAMKTPQMIVAHPSVKANTLQELLEESKSRDMTVGSAGNGSLGHLGLEYLKSTFNVKFIHVPYRGGAVAISDLLGGQIDLTIDNATAVLPYIKAGKLKPIALAGNTPYELAPEVPLVSEQFSEFDIYSWFGLMARKDTPKEVVDVLVLAMMNASKDPEVKETLASMGVEPGVESLEEFEEIIINDSKKWKEIIEKYNVSSD